MDHTKYSGIERRVPELAFARRLVDFIKSLEATIGYLDGKIHKLQKEVSEIKKTITKED